jgi:hypothetical protein
METNTQFQLTLPEGWKETTIFTFEGPHDSGVQHNLVLVVERDIPRKAGLVEWAQGMLGASKAALPGFEMISEKEIRLSGDLPCYEIVYRYTPSDERVLFQKQYYVILDKKGFIFSSTFSKKTLNTLAHEVDRIVAGLRVSEQ